MATHAWKLVATPLRRMVSLVAMVAVAAVLCVVPEPTQAASAKPAPAKPAAAKPAPAKPAPAKPAAPHHVTSTKFRPANRHLTRRAAPKPRAKRHKGRVVRTGVIGVIGLRRVVHHATGAVTGTVNAANSYPLPGASVHLTKANGHKLRSRRARHATTVNSGGEFTMHSVRPGKYRVVSSAHGHGKGHAQTRVRGNKTSTVHIKLK